MDQVRVRDPRAKPNALGGEGELRENRMNEAIVIVITNPNVIEPGPLDPASEGNQSIRR